MNLTNTIIVLLFIFTSCPIKSQPYFQSDTIINNEHYYILPKDFERGNYPIDFLTKWEKNYYELNIKDGKWVQLFKEDKSLISRLFIVENGMLHGSFVQFDELQNREITG